MGWTGMQGTHSLLAACCPARRLAPLLPSILYALACEEAQSHLSLLDGLAGADVRRCCARVDVRAEPLPRIDRMKLPENTRAEEAHVM